MASISQFTLFYTLWMISDFDRTTGVPSSKWLILLKLILRCFGQNLWPTSNSWTATQCRNTVFDGHCQLSQSHRLYHNWNYKTRFQLANTCENDETRKLTHTRVDASISFITHRYEPCLIIVQPFVSMLNYLIIVHRSGSIMVVH